MTREPDLRRSPPGGWLAAVVLSAAMFSPAAGAADAPPAAPSLAQQAQRSYYYVYEGTKLDRDAYAKLATQHRQEAEARQGQAAESAAKKQAYEKQLELARLCAALSQHNATIAKAFEQTVDEAEMLAAMEAVPKLEQRLAHLSGQPPAREWLTLAEVQARVASGMEFKTEAPDILPYATHHWFWPGAPAEGKRERPTIQRPGKEALK